MVTKNNVRDAASTLAHHWCGADAMDRVGVERVILAYPQALQLPLCALIMHTLEGRGFYTQAAAFEGWLFALADVDAES